MSEHNESEPSGDPREPDHTDSQAGASGGEPEPAGTESESASVPGAELAELEVVDAELEPIPAPAPPPPLLGVYPVAPAPAPVPAQLASEQVIVQAPMSYTGSLKRLSRMTGSWPLALKIPSLVIMTAIAWYVITVWYLLWGICLVPWRLFRRHERNEKRRMLQHRETLAAMQNMQQQQQFPQQPPQG
jgi:hypothetical protein